MIDDVCNVSFWYDMGRDITYDIADAMTMMLCNMWSMICQLWLWPIPIDNKHSHFLRRRILWVLKFNDFMSYFHQFSKISSNKADPSSVSLHWTFCNYYFLCQRVDTELSTAIAPSPVPSWLFLLQLWPPPILTQPVSSILLPLRSHSVRWKDMMSWKDVPLMESRGACSQKWVTFHVIKPKQFEKKQHEVGNWWILTDSNSNYIKLPSIRTDELHSWLNTQHPTQPIWDAILQVKLLIYLDLPRSTAHLAKLLRSTANQETLSRPLSFAS